MATLKATNDRLKEFVLILGMGRSGTSLCCQAIERFGYKFGTTFGGGKYNERGYYENQALGDLQYEMIERLTGMKGWLFRGAIADSVWSRVDAYADKAAKIIESQGVTCYKHPLAVRTYPFWVKVCEKLGREITAINCMREPGAIYASLVKMGMVKPSDYSKRELFKVWADFVHAAERVRPNLELWYEDWFQDPRMQMLKLCGALGGEVSCSEGLVEPELRHHG